MVSGLDWILVVVLDIQATPPNSNLCMKLIMIMKTYPLVKVIAVPGGQKKGIREEPSLYVGRYIEAYS